MLPLKERAITTTIENAYSNKPPMEKR